MATDANTLYKLMLLYMLNKVNFPLSNAQISEFILEREYTSYFTIQEVLNDLIANDYIMLTSYRNTTQYEITMTGKHTLALLEDQIPPGIKTDIDEYLKSKKYELKNEVGTVSDYYKSTNQDYIAHCQVKEGKATLIELNLAVPLEKQADAICARWRDNSQEIYEFIMKKLMY